MKEPWEVYHDEFTLGLKRITKLSADGEKTVKMEDLENLGSTLGQTVAYHLIDDRRWRKEDALELVRRFHDSVKRADERGHREALRDVWADWVLSHPGKV